MKLKLKHLPKYAAFLLEFRKELPVLPALFFKTAAFSPGAEFSPHGLEWVHERRYKQ